MLVVQACY